MDLYKDEKRRGSQNLLRSVQTEPKRNNAALLETILKDLPYKGKIDTRILFISYKKK